MQLRIQERRITSKDTKAVLDTGIRFCRLLRDDEDIARSIELALQKFPVILERKRRYLPRFVNCGSVLRFVAAHVLFLVHTCIRLSYRTYEELTGTLIFWYIDQWPIIGAALIDFLRGFLSLIAEVIQEVMTKTWLGLQNLLSHLLSDPIPTVQDRFQEVGFKKVNLDMENPYAGWRIILAESKYRDQYEADTDLKELKGKRFRSRGRETIRKGRVQTFIDTSPREPVGKKRTFEVYNDPPPIVGWFPPVEHSGMYVPPTRSSTRLMESLPWTEQRGDRDAGKQ
ncbi:MAG: hypothetical protein Q9174_005970 [Haloplaca sp. 1 TL-2023]